MRITVNYFEGYPELEAELSKHSPRARAERMRFLAAMGLAFMQDGRPHAVAVSTATPPAAAESTSTPSSPTTQAKGKGEVARSITKHLFDQKDD